MAESVSGGVSRKSLVVVIQCDQVTREVCSGFLCERAFRARTGGFAGYPAKPDIRYLSLSCGGCPGRAVARKLANLRRNLKKHENLDADCVAVHLSSCISRSNRHGPRCPHVGYLKGQAKRSGFACFEDSHISKLAERRRREGSYD